MKHLKIILLVSLFLCKEKTSFSQPDSILALPTDRQLLELWRWYKSDVPSKDSQQAIAEIVTMGKLFAKNGSDLLRQQAWLFHQRYVAETNADAENGAGIMLKAAGKAHTKNWPLVEAECWHFAGSIYFKGGLFVQGFEYMRKAQDVFDRYDEKKYPHILAYAGGIANCYYQFGEYGEALKYIKKAMKLPPSWNAVVYAPNINNTVALCYQQLKQYDSAAIWYKKSYESAAAASDSFYMALANGNLGFTYYLQKQYDEALPLLEADYKGSLQAGETGSATNAAMILAAIYIKKERLADAERYLSLTREFVYAEANDMLFKSWYENLYNLYKAKGDYRNTSLYTDSLLAYKDSVAAMSDKKAFNQKVLMLETERHMSDVSRLESRRKQQILLRNSLLAGLVLLTIIALLWVNRQTLKRNKETELARQRLRFAEQELANYIQKLKEKNELLEQLRNEISQENDSHERAGHLNSLMAATILTDDDWKSFRELFEKVYPGFFMRLKEKMPELSATDTRLLALTKLQLSPKDMAAMLGVSYDAIKKARQRLRKKINLPEEGGLEELVEMI